MCIRDSLKGAETDARRIQVAYYSHMLPDCSAEEVGALLERRKYVVLQGPPGTGKTRMALELLKDKYRNNGMTIQFQDVYKRQMHDGLDWNINVW